MRLNRPNDLPDRLHNGVVAIGNFDGVHRGHQAVLERAMQITGANGKPAIVLTFEPHPRTAFAPDEPVFRLSPAPMKARILNALGFDAVVEQEFTRTFAGQTAQEFINGILLGGLNAAHVVTGFDFHFGKGRQGGPAFLMEAGKQHGFDVTLVDAFRDEGAVVVSSSRIRDLLACGDVVEAAGLLGYRHMVAAEVVHGKKLGRTLNFPTANMKLPNENALAHGIYAVKFRMQDGTLKDGVASFGRRPTVTEDGAPLLETFVFDFDGDLYGQVCSVSFFGFLRGEMKFSGLEPLIEQMNRDVLEAKALLSGVRPLSELDLSLNF